MTQKFYVNSAGKFIGSWDGFEPEDETLTEVPEAPPAFGYTWDFVAKSWAIKTEFARSVYESKTQEWMDSKAKDAGYDSLLTAISYAEEPAVAKFQDEGKAFRAWRSIVWAYANEQLALVLAGQKAQPTVDAFIESLPLLELPA